MSLTSTLHFAMQAVACMGSAAGRALLAWTDMARIIESVLAAEQKDAYGYRAGVDVLDVAEDYPKVSFP